MVSSPDWNVSATGYASQLAEYKETVSRLFPILPKDCVDVWSISEADVLALGLLLDCYPQKVTVLDIGSFLGASAFFFASHSKVTRVVSVDPNPTIAEEINDKSEMLGVNVDPEPLGNLRVLDVARTALAEFPDENRKIQLHAGTVGTRKIGITEDATSGSQRLEEPMSEVLGERSLVAFVDGLHTREGVHADLEVIFDHNPRAVAILHDCRHAWGPFVQAGVVGFMEGTRDEYDFRLLGDLGPALATSNLGVVYPRAHSGDVQRALADFTELFSERLDPLSLMRREEDLISTVNYYKRAANTAARLQERNSRLEEDNDNLRKRNSQLDERNAAFKVRNSQLNEQNSQLKERNSQLNEQNSQLKERIGQLGAAKGQLGERNSQLNEQNSQLKERNGHLRERNSQLNEHNSRLKERNSELTKRSSQLEEQISKLKQENSQLVVYRSSRRYKIADAVARKVQWLPDAVRRPGNRPEQ
jgi:predicted nuclease with TOPRIM domain